MPTLGIERGSNIAAAYISHLKAFADKNNGKLVLSKALESFNWRGRSQTIINCPY